MIEKFVYFGTPSMSVDELAGILEKDDTTIREFLGKLGSLLNDACNLDAKSKSDVELYLASLNRISIWKKISNEEFKHFASSLHKDSLKTLGSGPINFWGSHDV